MQSRMGPSSAEAKLRVMKLKHETMLATAAAGPRIPTGIFKAACSTDLLFLIDATGSMHNCIEAVKVHVKGIVKEINERFFQQADIRVAVVGYRDHGDHEPMEFIDFTSDVDKIFNFLDQLKATGGYDTAENVLGGMDTALKASWKYQTRCIMHFADAPAHGSDLNKLKASGDRFRCPGSEPHRLLYKDVLGDMAKAKTNYVFFRINKSCDMMIEAFFEVYLQYTSNCKLHSDNEFFLMGQTIARKKKQGDKALSNKQYLEEKMRSEGGIYFEEASLVGGYDVLREVIVNGVMASSSRTAVRLSTTLSTGKRTSFTKPKGNPSMSTKLNDLAEDEEVDVFEEAREWQKEPDVRGGVGLGTATTAADTIVEEDEEEWEDEQGAQAPVLDDFAEGEGPSPALDDLIDRGGSVPDDKFEFEYGPPQWNKKGWLDQTTHFKAFSPDVVDRNALGTDGAGPSETPMGSILDRMIASDDNIGISTNELTICRRTKPFAQGALRLASYARTQESTNPLVIKTFKKKTKRLADLVEDMRIQALCKAYALEFNNLVRDKSHSLDFIIVTCLQPLEAAGKGNAADGSAGGEDQFGCMSLEPMLPRENYIKYNNNCGGVSPTESKYNMSAQAFSHFTFERSQGELMVCDLQGVDNILTDPAIHTRDPSRFVLSDTNLSEDGFKLFFSSHRCNTLCAKMSLRSQARMFVDNDFRFRTVWPTPTPLSHIDATILSNGAEKMSVCCANKLCGKIVSMSTAKMTPPSFYWCSRCWPQLKASTVKRVCGGATATGGAYHEFEVSKFFYESQGQLLPTSCPEHGGTPDLPAHFKASTFKKLGIFRRLRPGSSA